MPRVRGYFLCDRCGLQFTRDKMRTEWTGLIVDPGCLDPQPPQQFPQHRDFSDPTPYRDVRQPTFPQTWVEWDQRWRNASIPWGEGISQ